MQHSGFALSEFFRQYVARGEPLVLATIVQTLGSTYRKPGAHMLIAGDGRAAGLLSGGCLEADLIERARIVIATGEPSRVEYDTRTSDDLVWGLGLGCEGAMSILLTRLAPDNGYEPFAFIEQQRERDVSASFALVTSSRNPAYPLGLAFWTGSPITAPTAIAQAMSMVSAAACGTANATLVAGEDVIALVVPIDSPLRVVVLGAGPDAAPLVEIMGLMGWRVTVLDHRPAYALADRFPHAQRVAVNPASDLAAELGAQRYDAAVVMSHHLLSDQAYLSALADSSIPYVGLLGPAPRRMRLMSEIGARAERLKPRLYGPIGLDIGAATPETIALAIASEIQAVLAGRSGRSFRESAA